MGAEILECIEKVVGGHKRPISLHEPTLGELEREAILACLDSGWVSSVGPFITEFESVVAKSAGAAHGVAVVNGTAALHAALLLSNVLPDDEVIIPALTFVATANAVKYAHAMPHFVDVAPDTMGIDPTALRKHLVGTTAVQDGRAVNKHSGRTIKAMIPVHVFGHLADMQAINAVAAEFGIMIVEDATESLGSHFAGERPRLSARLAVVSFNGNKIITTGGGGMILTDDAELGFRAKHLTTTAKKPHAWAFDHDMVGFNYRLPNLNAALGIAQMQRLDGFLANKRLLAERYDAALSGARGVNFFRQPDHSVSNYWLNAILLDDADEVVRDAVLAHLRAAGIIARPVWTPLNRMPMYRDAPAAPLPVTDNLAARVINLPSSPFLAQTPRSS